MTKKADHKNRRKWPRVLLALLAVAIVCEAALFSAVVINASRLNNPQQGDAIIVLGARIYPDSSPTPALERRLDLAASLYMEGYAGTIITTGAQGHDEPEPEADAMKAYLVSLGVPAEAVFAESDSYNTQENLQNAKDIMDTHGLHTAIVVSSDYHLWRTLTMCRAIGLTATGAGSQNALTWPVAIRNCLQETLSWAKYTVQRVF